MSTQNTTPTLSFQQCIIAEGTSQDLPGEGRSSLNRLLIEGTAGTPTLEPYHDERYGAGDGPGTPVVRFEIRARSNRFGVHDYTVYVTRQLARRCLDYVHAGRTVRIVGQLITLSGRPVIYAEHVEFRPNFRTAHQEDHP